MHPQTTLQLCPHHLGHYLGMDVHDVDEMSRDAPLKPGTAVTIEPGIWADVYFEEIYGDILDICVQWIYLVDW